MKKFLAMALTGAMCSACWPAAPTALPAPPAPLPAAPPLPARLPAPPVRMVQSRSAASAPDWPAATYGIATKQGAEIAVDEINALGGIQLSLEFQDDEGDAEKAINAYNALKGNGMQIVYGCTTTTPCVSVAAETFNERYFQLTPSASSTDVTAGKDNVFQMCFTDPDQGVTAADYVAENGLATKVAVIYNNGDAYSTGIAQGFISQAAEVGLEVVAEQTFPDDTNTDFTVQLNAAKDGALSWCSCPFTTPRFPDSESGQEHGL